MQIFYSGMDLSKNLERIVSEASEKIALSLDLSTTKLSAYKEKIVDKNFGRFRNEVFCIVDFEEEEEKKIYSAKANLSLEKIVLDCNCPDFLKNSICSHLITVMNFLLTKKKELLNFLDEEKRLLEIKKGHQNYAESKKIKELISSFKSEKTLFLKELISKDFQRVIVASLAVRRNALIFELKARKIGAKGQPIKTGEFSLGINELIQNKSLKFNEIIKFVSFLDEEIIDSGMIRNSVFKIEDFFGFKRTFEDYPFLFWNGSNEKAVFGPTLKVKIRKNEKTNENSWNYKVILEDEAGHISIGKEGILQNSVKGERYNFISIYGKEGFLGVVSKECIYPIECNLSKNQLITLFEKLDSINFDLVKIKNKKEIELEFLSPLNYSGVIVEDSDIFEIYPIEEKKPKGIWKLTKEGSKFNFEFFFRYGHQNVYNSDSSEIIFCSDKKANYKRMTSHEENLIEKVGHTFQDFGINKIGLNVMITVEEALLIVDEIFPLLSEEIILEYDERILKISKKRPEIRIETQSGIDWFGVTLKLSASNKKIDWATIKSLFDKKLKYFEIDGEFFKIDPKEFEKFTKIASKLKEFQEFSKNPWHNIELLREIEEISPESLDPKAREYLKKLSSFKDFSDYSLPEKLNGILRNYQKIGFNWLRFLEEYKLSGILADDMGLGKTIQTITVLLSYKERFGSLNSIIIAPKSLLKNWQNEINKFAPDLKTIIYHGSKEERENLKKEDSDSIITTFATYRNDSNFFIQKEFDYAVIDEAQNLKNKSTQTFKEMKKLCAKHKIALSGTPLENSMNDLKNIFDFLLPGFLGSDEYFKNEYVVDPQKLLKKIKPLILRRKKEEVLKELPPKTIKNFLVDMTESQRKIYDNYLLAAREELENSLENPILFEKNRMKILTHILRLRQISCHPALTDIKFSGEKFSGKLGALFELLGEVVSEGSKVIVFSQFAHMLQIIESEALSLPFALLRIDGKTNNREKILRKFQTENKYPILLMTLKVGNLGLNLTQANYVVLFDPWWNPAAEMQAIDRAHRMGQKKPVFVYKMISNDTIEEKVLLLQEKKMELVEKIIESPDLGKSRITREDIISMIQG